MSSIRYAVTTRQALVALFMTSVLLVGIPLIGAEPRHVSFARAVPVDANSPPSITVPNFPSVYRQVPCVFNVIASDPDQSDELLFTWYWGDETISVTSQPEATHVYFLKGIFELTVWVDDQTGRRDHNVSDVGLVSVSGTNQRPVIVDFSIDDDTPFTDQIVTFSGTATDPDLDLLWLQFNFGDGRATTLWQSSPGQTLTAAHTYPNIGTYVATLTVSDSQAAPVTSSPMYLNVEHAPYFILKLVTGWNWVSIPVVGSGFNASTLRLDPGDTVSKWDPITKTYKSYIVGVPVNDFTIAPGTGFWINVPSGTRAITLYGTVPTGTQQINITVPGIGWACIGLLGFNTTRHASDLSKMYSGDIYQVVRWEPVYRFYSSWIPIIPLVNDFLLVPGQAYWLLCTSGTLTYTP